MQATVVEEGYKYIKDGVKYLLLTHYSRISFLDLVILTFAFSIKAIYLNCYHTLEFKVIF